MSSRVNALVMSGGGARGAFELGVLDYLIRDKGLDFQVITGVSVGALNAAMLAQGKGPEGLREALEGLKSVYFSIRSCRDVYLKRGPARILDLNSTLWDLLGAVKGTSLYDLTPLFQKIHRYIDPEKLRTSGRELRVGVVSLQSGQYRSVDQTSPEIRKFVLASASIPFFFSPVEIESEQYVDGGVRNVTPLHDAFEALRKIHAAEAGKPCIYVVLASPLEIGPLTDGTVRNVPDVLMRTTDIMISEIYRNDLEHAQRINTLVEIAQRLESHREELEQLGPGDLGEELADLKGKIVAEIIVIEPAWSYIGSLEFSPAKIREAFEAGKRTAQETLA